MFYAEVLPHRVKVNNLLPPAAAKDYFEGHIIFEISLREISKMMCPSKDN
jgi:hypothetical protein